MAKLLRLRRGTSTQHNGFTGAEGEITVDTTKDVIVVHDGTTPGGRPLLRQDLSNLPAGSVTSSHLTDGAIVDADINASAGITSGKLATTGVTAGNYGASTAVPVLSINSQGQITGASTAPLPAGIVTTSDTGTVTSTMIADGTLVNEDISASAGIAHSKLASITAGQVLVGNASNVATATTVSGDATFSSSGALTFANSGVTADTYNNSATAVTPFTVDAKGRITATGVAVTVTPAFSSVTSKPTTLTGYGITDAAPLASPALTGTPTSTTAAAGTNTTQIATTAFVASAVAQVPQNAKTSAYTLVAADAGKHISITTGGVTTPASVFAIGDVISIYNNSATAQTIVQGASVTLRQAGSANTGNRSIAGYGVATLLCVAVNTFVISGAGVS